MSSLPDKNHLYGKFQKTEDWRDRLHRKLSHKSLDIADPDEVNVDNSRRGLGWKEMAILALAGFGGLHLYQNQNAPVAPTQPPAVVSPIDTEYDVRFYDKDGRLIDVQPLSQFKPPTSD